MINVKAVKLQNIQEKDMYYIVLEQGANRIIINTGEKNYSAVKEMLDPSKKEVNKDKPAKS